jgi:hypothetical protein
MTEIFVFGSNLAGIHKKGAALCALKEHGAILGNGVGLQGCSYAIPTKRTPYETLSKIEINKYVAEFISFAHWAAINAMEYQFKVTPIGCGLAGYNPSQIAPMFYYALELPNVILPPEFLSILQL